LKTYAKLIKRIAEVSKRRKKIITDLLTFSRQAEVKFKPLRINRLIGQTLSLVKHQFRMEEIKLVKHYDPGHPRTLGNAQQLRQVFLNMFLNAINAMPAGGRMTVETEVLSEKRMVAIRISDTGVGIPKEEVEQLFEPLVAGSGDKGMDLGLRATRSIIARHKGTIGVASEEGKGTTFTVRLPVR